MSYKIVLNILIVFLCTSCCACVDCDEPGVDIFYLRIEEDGQNAILKYNIEDSRDYRGNNNLRLAYFIDDAQNRAYTRTYVEGDSTNPYLAVSFESSRLSNGKIYSLWLENTEVGKLFIKTKSTKKAFDCCASYKIETINSRSDSVIVTKEDKNFYKIQF